MTRSIFIICVLFAFHFNDNLHAQKTNKKFLGIRIPNKDTIHLKFNSDGQLETKFRSRYKRKHYPVEVLAEIPLKEIKDGKNTIDKTLYAISDVLSNKKGVLYNMFLRDSSASIISTVFDSTKFYKNDYNSTEKEFFPEEFKTYAQFSALLQEEYADDCYINIRKFSKIFPLKFYFNNKEQKLVNDSIFYNASEKKYFAKYQISWDTKSEFSYQLKKVSPLKKGAINWSNDLIAKNDSSLRILSLIEKVIFSQSANIASIESLIDSLDMSEQFPKNSFWDKETASIFDNLKAKTDSLYNLIGPFNSLNIFMNSPILRNWIVKWLWLNGDVVQLNPFKFTTAFAKSVSDHVTEMDDSIRMNFYDSTIKYLPHNIADEKRLDSIISKINIVLNRKVVGIESNSKSTVGSSANDKALKDFTTISNYLYKGSLTGYRRNGDRKIWTRNYYFGESPPANTNSFIKYYPEDECAAIYYHNVPASSPLHIKFTYQPFPDSEGFTVNAAGSVGLLVNLFESLNPITAIWKDISRSLKKSPFSTSNQQIFSLFWNDSPTESLYDWRDYIHTLSVFTKSNPLITQKLNSINDTNALYNTIYEIPEAKDTSIICYGIYRESKGDKDKIELVKIDTSSYKISKLHYVELAAGISYTPHAGNITSVDTTGGKFQINKDDDKFRLIAGIRWYPFGAYNQQNLFRRFDIKHAVSILAATGIPKPLENWYSGIGIDLVPGLNINAGFHFQQKNKYTIENNSIKGRKVTYTQYGFVGITMDPDLLIKVFTSLFK